MVTETHVAPSSEKETEIWTHQLKKGCEQFVTGHAMRQQPRWKSVQPRNPFDPAFRNEQPLQQRNPQAHFGAVTSDLDRLHDLILLLVQYHDALLWYSNLLTIYSTSGYS
jgi:hypothetical protein